MANDANTGPLETGAEMDYEEHDRTYSLFIAMSKYGALACAALMIAMAFGFFTSAGFISATLLFVVIVAVGFFLL